MRKLKSDSKVGVIGLGLMGSALADALVDQGFNLLVWNRSRDKCKRFADAGTKVADSTEGLAAESDIVIVCLTDHAASTEILQIGSVAKNLKGKVLVLLSTMSTDESVTTAKWADTNQTAYLDGAILGYPANVRNQECMIVYSGSTEVYKSCVAVLKALGGMPRLVGDRAGVSLQFDKAIYSTYYTHVIGLFHGAAICKAAGAPLDVFIEATTNYWDFGTEDAILLNRIKNRDYSMEEAPLELHAAAYGHIPALSEKLGVSNKLPQVISEYFKLAMSQGHKDSELPALFEVLSNHEAI